MIEIVEAILYALAGWRFLLSPDFRERTLARWRDESGLRVMQDIVGGATGMLLSVLLPLFSWSHFSGSSLA